MLCAVRSAVLSGRSAAAAAVGSKGSAWFSSTSQLRAAGSDRKDEDRVAEGEGPSGLTPGAFGGATAGDDEVAGSGPHKQMGEAEGGTDGGIAGAWRGMTETFTVGADDMAGDTSAGTIEDEVGMKVNPDDLPPGPAEVTGPAALAREGGFGQRRDPQGQEDKRAPEDLAQKARDINTAGAQEDATASGPKPWSA